MSLESMVRSRAVTSVLELLIMHPMNVVSVRRVAGFDKLLQGLTNITVPLTLDRASLQASPAVRFGETICECLCYSAVLMSRHNFGVLQDTLRFCIDQTTTMHPGGNSWAN
ncbi:hypothetical protein T484DRAFT_1850942 [Baffinella frigidus]|nr:hypothetical protein T484DRAFT_1850942 [Cryptophyta sp. CCMP2293]